MSRELPTMRELVDRALWRVLVMMLVAGVLTGAVAAGHELRRCDVCPAPPPSTGEVELRP